MKGYERGSSTSSAEHLIVVATCTYTRPTLARTCHRGGVPGCGAFGPRSQDFGTIKLQQSARWLSGHGPLRDCNLPSCLASQPPTKAWHRRLRNIRKAFICPHRKLFRPHTRIARASPSLRTHGPRATCVSVDRTIEPQSPSDCNRAYASRLLPNP
jgi:hypothetical protein